ncbi:hypothetical protein B0J18DRAFT_252058 [Chaetomium sp. MPI-SDFR-AT-0129]|nr:hypothetical protein B0J18DRAFT_252058 [Chaetomium sp. MPI-SDFR-AT-0129]
MAARDAGDAINLLSLDDGGVRGVVPLLILHELMVQIQLCYDLKKTPKPCEYFHMIGGTGTGGLIAIMLGRLRMSTEEALQEYGRCTKEMFSLGNRKWTTATERYRATGLKEAVENLVRRRNIGDDLVDLSLEPDSKGLCFVCAMPVSNLGQPRRFRSFYTPKDIYGGVKIWEAVRATTAASLYFKPMSVTTGEREPEEFADAAIDCSNPINYVLREAAAHFGAKRRLGTIVSTGTGIRAVGIKKSATRSRATADLMRGGQELIRRPENPAADTEGAHRDIEERLGPYRNAYFRFNVPDVADEVGLDKYLKIRLWQAATATYLAEPSVMAQSVKVALLLDHDSVSHELSLGLAAGVINWKGNFKSYATQFLGQASRFFIAKDSVLQKMDVCFSPRDVKGRPRREFLLFGPSGVGKTQIALKFANQVEKRFKYIFHIDGSNPSSVSQTYANICEQYCPGYSPRAPNDSADVEDMKQVALNWISGLSVEWLIIYDNLPDSNHPGSYPCRSKPPESKLFGPKLPDSDLPNFTPTLPGQNTGNIIYTSHSQGKLASLPPNCTYEVGPFTVEESLQLLLNLVGLENVEENDKEIEALRETAAEVGCLPFALGVAGAYLRKEGCTPLTYLQRFRDCQKRLGFRGGPVATGSSPTRSGLYTALELSYEALLDMHKTQVSSLAGVGAAAASAILNLFCFYHNVDIPLLMMGLSAEERRSFEGSGVHSLSEFPNPPLMSPTLLLTCRSAGKGWDSTALHLGAQCLRQFSLVKWNPKKNTVSMHPLVQVWARDRMSTDDRKRQAWAAQVVLIESIKPGWDRLDRAILRGLPPHLDVCMSYESEPFGHHDKHKAWLDLKLAWYFYEKRMLLEAVKLIEKALRVQKRNHGNHSREATNCLRILGRVSSENGYMANAESAYACALELLNIRREEILDNKQKRLRPREENIISTPRLAMPRVLKLRHSASQTAIDTGVELSILAKNGTSTKPKTRNLDSGQSLANHEHFAQNIDQASTAQAFVETLSDWEREVGAVLSDMADLYFDTGRQITGIECLQKALSTIKNVDKADQSLEIWKWENELNRHTKAYDSQDWEKNQKTFDALPLDGQRKWQLYGNEYFWWIGWAARYFKLGNLDKAYGILEDLLPKTTVAHGPSNPKTLFLLRSLAVVAEKRERYEKAEELAMKAVETAKAVYTEGHHETATSLHTLAMVLPPRTLHLGPGSEFWEGFKRAYKSCKWAFLPVNPLTENLRHWLGVFDFSQTKTKRESFPRAVVELFANGFPKSRKAYLDRACFVCEKVSQEVEQEESRLRREARRANENPTRPDSMPPQQPPSTEQETAAEHAEPRENEVPVISLQPALDVEQEAQAQGSRVSHNTQGGLPNSDVRPSVDGGIDTQGDNTLRVPVGQRGGGAESGRTSSGSAKKLPEELSADERDRRWVLTSEVRLGFNWRARKASRLHMWTSTRLDNGSRKLRQVLTGAIITRGEPRWRRIRCWADLDALFQD